MIRWWWHLQALGNLILQLIKLRQAFPGKHAVDVALDRGVHAVAALTSWLLLLQTRDACASKSHRTAHACRGHTSSCLQQVFAHVCHRVPE